MTQDLDFCDTSFTELAAIVAEHLKQWSIDVVVGGLAVEICANNLYAISVPYEKQTAAATIAQKAEGYGFEGLRVDGMDLLADLRRHEQGLPVVILTARDAIDYRLDGLHAGADDYLVKPFDLRELAARLHAVVRRGQGRAVQAIAAGPLRLEPESGQAWLDGEVVALSRREIDLLTQLADARGRWLSAEVLHERLYGLDVDVGSNALNVHIHNVRRKLGPGAIETVRGLGYRLGWRPE